MSKLFPTFSEFIFNKLHFLIINNLHKGQFIIEFMQLSQNKCPQERAIIVDIFSKHIEQIIFILFLKQLKQNIFFKSFIKKSKNQYLLIYLY